MKTIALLSGKGGSGKTTLGLTMSSLLSKAGISTLLIDCDFSTNGATFFFEEQMGKSAKISSLRDLLLNKETKFSPLSVFENFSFIPSVTKINAMRTDKVLFDVYKEEFSTILTKCDGYDIVIFDCQAGNSNILYSVLLETDVVLIVLEPDKVSSAALRSLYTKTGELLQDKEVYQVFNKVDKEDKLFYEKITFGTFFTNVGALLYDSAIRNSFAFSIIPNIEEDAIDYGMQIGGLCERIIVDIEIRNKIKAFEKVMVHRKLRIELTNQTRQLNQCKEKRKKYTELDQKTSQKARLFKMLTDLFPVFVTVLFVIVALTIYRSMISANNGAIILLYSIIFYLCFILIYALTRRQRVSRDLNIDNKYLENELKIEELQKSIDVLERDIADIDNTIIWTKKHKTRG